MKVKFDLLPFLFIYLFLLFINCSDRKKAELVLDFSSREDWYFNFSSSISGKASFRDSSQSFSSTIGCILHGEGKKDSPFFITLSPERVKVRSNYLNSAEIYDLKKSLSKETVEYSLKRGIENSDVSRYFSLSHAGKWKLFRHGLKVLPALPEKSVAEGETWERATDIPIDTPHGEAAGHLYQSFVFDSLTEDNNAHISWIFNYSVESFTDDTAGLLDDLPRSGQGHGRAVLDLSNKALESARIEFRVIQDITDEINIIWKESASLELEKALE